MLYDEHYQRDWSPVYGVVSEFWDTYSRPQQRDMLEGLFPGVADLWACWDEVRHVADQLNGLDATVAVSEMQERGGYDGDPVRAFDTIRGELELTLRQVIRDHRRAGAEQLTRPRLAVAS